MYREAGADLYCVREGISEYRYYRRDTLTAWDGWAVAGDPLLTNPAAYDFTLQANSAAIDAGVDVGFTEDFAGDPVPVYIRVAPPTFAEFFGGRPVARLSVGAGSFDYWLGNSPAAFLSVTGGTFDHWYPPRLPPANPAQPALPDCGVYEYRIKADHDDPLYLAFWQ